MVDEYNRDEALRRFQRGVVLERANRLKEAVNEYHQALIAYPHLREAHDALGWYYLRCGLLARAAEEFRIAANLDGDLRSLFNLGYVLARLEQYDDAVTALEQCLALAPNNPATLYELSLIACARGDYQRALEQLAIPLKSYPDDWEVYLLRGNCYLGLRRYDEALAAFGEALLLTDSAIAQADVLRRIASVERHREFRKLGTAKDQMYVDEGVVYLGSAQDDGLQVAEVQDYHFTYPDIGTTIQRLLALQQSYRWQFTAIVALDKLGQPLAAALARITGVPLRSAGELTRDDTALLVLAVAKEAELLQLTIERIPCLSMTFCLGLNWLRHSRLLPEVIGIAARNSCSVPWEAELRRLRSVGAPATEVESCLQRAIDDILAAVSDTPFDANLPRQMRYYTRTHRRLNMPITSAPSARSAPSQQ